MKVFRVVYDKSQATTVDIQAEHIGLAIGKALSYLHERRYTYKIEDCTSAELIANPVQCETKTQESQS